MVVRENIDLYRYEIHSLVKAFYPEQNMKVVVAGDPHAEKILKEDPDVFMDVEMEERTITLRIHGEEREWVRRLSESARAGEKQNDGSSEIMAADRSSVSGEVREKNKIEGDVPGAEESDLIDYTFKCKRTKDALKTFLYDVLSEYTGRKLPWGDLIGIRPTKIAMTKMEEGASSAEAEQFMIREHQVSREKAELAVNIAERERRILSGIHYENGYSLYVGIPFCPTTCLYCSFPSFNIALWQDRIDDYLTALEKEMAVSAEIMKGKVLDTVYIGGGTPTSLSAEQMDRLLSSIERYWHIQSGRDGAPVQNEVTPLEFTVEAGRADSITRAKLEVMHRHPVTRISVNPQTMKDETLRIIGRRHTVQQVVDAFTDARECGFDNINMDIILGLPGENASDVRNTVEAIERLSPDSLTVHSLAIKRASRLRRVIDEKGYPVLINTDETMKIAADAAARMGMKPYYLYRQKNMSGNFENVGYARDGKYGVYNILIMEEKQTIMALGAGAITKRVFHQPDGNTRIERCDNPKDIKTYLENTDEMLERKRKLFAE